MPVLESVEIVTAGLQAGMHRARAAGTRLAYAADPSLNTLQVVVADG